MFLHSGAGLHGHEFSSRPVSPSIATSSASSSQVSRSRSALIAPKTRVRVDGPLAPPAIRQRPVSDYIPRKLSPEPTVRFKGIDEEEVSTAGAHEDGQLSESEASEVTTFSVDALSTKAGMRRRRRASHKSTRYSLGYPTPSRLDKTRVIKKVVPRLLLQLQRISEDGKSRPVLEVFPATRIAGPVVAPRLARRFPGIFGVKRHLGYDDLVLVRRDDDCSSSDTDSDEEESLEKRRLLAVYSPLRHSEEAEIVLEDGSVWVAKPRANGSYDFVHIDEHGVPTTVRWVRRSDTNPGETGAAKATPPTVPSPSRFTFSVISPLTRRHPVLATLTQSSLEIQDTYTPISTSYSQQPSTTYPGRARSMTAPSSASFLDPISASSRTFSMGSTTTVGGNEDSIAALPLVSEIDPRQAQPVDRSIKMLISVTAMWVTLRSGWSAAQKLNAEPVGTPSNSAKSSRRHTWSRTNSEICTKQSPQVSESEPPTGPTKRYSMPLLQGDKFCASSPTPTRTSTPVSGSRAGSREPSIRGTSSGATFMQRRNQKLEAIDPDVGKKACHSIEPPCSPTPLKATESVTVSLATSRALPRQPSPKTKKRAVEKENSRANMGMRSRISKWIRKIGSR